MKQDSIVRKVKASLELSQQERVLLKCIVDNRALKTKFEDCIVDQKVIDVISTVVSLPIVHPNYFKKGILASEAVTGALFYGPPGTGKTQLCRALANECGARMLLISPSDILSKMVGDSEMLATAAFTLAYRLAPCIILFDEVDALLGSRDKHERSWETSLLTEFMQAMDGFRSAQKNKEKNIVVVGATNRPYDIDEAVLRRLPCQIFIDLPDDIDRESMLKLFLKTDKLSDDVDLNEIARQTDGYSGSDLKNLCVSAALASVSSAIAALNLQKSQTTASTAGEDLNDISDAKVQTPPEESAEHTISQSHFEYALEHVIPSFSEKSNEKLYQWHGSYTRDNIIPAPNGGRGQSNPAPDTRGVDTGKDHFAATLRKREQSLNSTTPTVVADYGSHISKILNNLPGPMRKPSLGNTG